MLPKTELNEAEKRALKDNIIFPKLTKKALTNIEIKPSKEDCVRLLSEMKKGYGSLINLNKENDLKLQYHGRFKSFVIGFGVHPYKQYQPKIKLLRIETEVESAHKDKPSEFIGAKISKGIHFHWYNTVYEILSEKIKHADNTGKESYEKMIEDFLSENKTPDLNKDIIKLAIPYSHFEMIKKCLLEESVFVKEDGYISKSEKITGTPEQIFNQIIKGQIF